MKSNDSVIGCWHPVRAACRIGLGLMATTAAAAFAQTPPQIDAAASTSSEADPGEIIVTANKREQSLNDVGLTVAVLGSDQLAERKIVSLADVAAALPGLSYSSSEQNTPVFTLRGVGFNEASLAAYPTVSVYIDEAPLPFPVLSGQGAYDLQRIEVLKGPQGTLFGQNSTGGAINYIAAKPTDRFAAGGDVSYGRFDTVELNGYISGPLSETIKMRVAGHVVRGDDWQRSYTRRDTLGRSEVYAGRAILDWTPSDRIRFALTVNAWQDKSDPQAGQLIGIFPQLPATASAEVVNATFGPRSNRSADWSYGTNIGPRGELLDPPPSSNRRLAQTVLRSDFDILEDVTLTSLTSYIAFRQRQSVDYDGIPANDTDLPRGDGRIRSIFQELRLSNGGKSDFRWLLGANYQRSRVKESDEISQIDVSTSNAALFFIYQNGFRSNTLRRDHAIFGNAEYDLSEVLTLRAGARYTKSLTAINSCNFDLGDGRINQVIDFLSALFTGNPGVRKLQPGDCVSLKADFTAGTPFIDRLKEDNVSWKFGVDYKPSNDLLIYTNVSRGFKAGAYPTISASTEVQLQAVVQERVTAYEAGFKSTLADRAVTFNGAAFYYDYGNKQIRGKLLDPVFGVLNALINVPKTRLYGFELETSVRPVEGLTISASGTYVNSRVQRYTGTNVLGQQQNFAGDSIPFSPKWQGVTDVEYRWERGQIRPFLGATINARTSTTAYIGGEDARLPVAPLNRTAPGADLPFRIKGYSTVDLRAGAEWGDGRWRAMIWGKNVFDRYYWQNVISGFDTIYRLSGRPATYGVTLGLKI